MHERKCPQAAKADRLPLGVDAQAACATFCRGMRKSPFMPKSRLLAFLVKELREVLPPTVFFAVGFNLIVLTTDLILADYLVSFGSFMVATITALVVGKAVLVDACKNKRYMINFLDESSSDQD